MSIQPFGNITFAFAGFAALFVPLVALWALSLATAPFTGFQRERKKSVPYDDHNRIHTTNLTTSAGSWMFLLLFIIIVLFIKVRIPSY